MTSQKSRRASNLWSLAFALALSAGICMTFPTAASAQATAAVNGTIRDTTGAVIPGATVVLHNVETNVDRTVTTNDVGVYVLPDIPPGNYTLKVSKEGFTAAEQANITLVVNQTATFDLTLSPGSVKETVTVQATAAALETSTSELGVAIVKREVNDLPLNGRNFTQLLSLTPGVSTVNVSQNSAGAGGIWSSPIGAFSYPAVNGQTNRSDLFMLDGVVNQGSFGSTYGAPPIVDGIQEFKVQSHNDDASFGGSLGGIINVATKAGTNDFHGSAWEFLRNTRLDARNTFLPTRTPFQQNQFGGTVGGPVILPSYNGRNKTFFFATYEGYRNHTAAQSFFRTPTAAELGGDLSDIPVQLYNPFSTRPDPTNPGKFIRDPFMCGASGNPLPTGTPGTPCNKIPASLIDPHMVQYAQTLFPAPINTGNPAFNGLDTTKTITRQDEGSLRFDHQLKQNDSVWLRYTGYSQPLTGSAGFTGQLHKIFSHGYNVGAGYVHTFAGSAVLDAEFGRTSANINQFTDYKNGTPGFGTAVGFSPNFAGNFIGGNVLIPNITILGFLGNPNPSAHNAAQVDKTHLSDTWEYKGNFSKTYRSHTFKMGADFARNNADALYLNGSVIFNAFETANPENPGSTGSALASFLLGTPNFAGRRNVHETQHGGWVDGFYFMDQWKVTSKLTANLGLRYDVTLVPIYGEDRLGNNRVGDVDLDNGTYILERTAPPCAQVGHAPCIPTPDGSLPAHVVLTPFKNGAIYHNDYHNVQPRVGIAYLLRPQTVARLSYGRFFDNWAAITQTAQNFEGTWPDVGQLQANNLNSPSAPGGPLPTASAEDPFSLGSGQFLPAPTPFNQLQWFMDPFAKRPYSDQWNLGIQQQLGANAVLTANYVGSHSGRLDVGAFRNVAVTPGPGNPQDRAPFPYISPTFFDKTIGRSNYNAFQFSLNGHSQNLSYLISYTWSKAIDIGCSGWYGVEGCSVQDPYHLDHDRSVAGFDVPQILSIAGVYRLPFGQGQRFDTGNKALNYVVGNWQINGIASFSSGTPYDVGVSGDIANTGNGGCCNGYYERLNLVGNPNPPNRTPSHWLNPAAFQVPAPFTFGGLGRDALRSDRFKNFDLSFFRQFPITESKKFEFRFEMFNAFNYTVFAVPDRNFSDPNFGVVSSIANTPRQMQFGLKFYF